MPVLPETLVLRGGSGAEGAAFGDRVVLRDWRAADAPALEPVCGDPDVCRFTSVPWTYTPEAARAWIERTHVNRAAGTVLALAIARDEDGPALGNVNLARFEGADAALGYWLAPAARGARLATAATRTLCAWGFEQLGLERIELAILPENTASQRVAERLSARPEGLRRDSHEADGRRWDMRIYALAAPPPSPRSP